MIRYSSDWSEDAVRRLQQSGAALGISPLHILQVMFSESNARANARNPNGGAVGLIQFMPDTLVGLGWSSGSGPFAALSPFDQMPYVHRYLAQYTRQVLNTPARVYVAVFLPALLPVATHDDYVLCAKDGRLGWAYEGNAGFDANKDLVITVGELQQAIDRNCHGARYEELRSRTLGIPPVDQSDLLPTADVRTPRGLQRALSDLGYDIGPLDGVVGPRTRICVRHFQIEHDLAPDMIVGPLTRAALVEALAQRHS